MTTDELRALVAELAGDRRRFTLEDAVREGAGWVAYLYEARSGATYRVSDYRAYRAHSAYPPVEWITWERRIDRNGRDYSMLPAAITLAELQRILAQERDGAYGRLCGIHVYYDELDDDRYVVVVAPPGGSRQEYGTLAAYLKALP